jgi:hypothetical protein
MRFLGIQKPSPFYLAALIQMKKIAVFLIIFAGFNVCHAQIQDGDIVPDFNTTDINGTGLSLYDTLGAGKTVVLHFFATWDSFSWDYLQGGQLQQFNQLYGASGSDQVSVWSIESEPSNSLAQLQGPASVTGQPATQTYGDWITGNNVTIIDDASIAAFYGINNLPAVLIICPDAQVTIAGEYSSQMLYDDLMSGCDQLTPGTDPAVVEAQLNRECSSTSADAVVVIKNLGVSPLESLDIQFLGTLGDPVFNWSGTLESYQSDTLYYNDLQLLNDDPVEVVIASLNDNYSNDTVSVSANVALSMMNIQLELALDAYPEEVSWEIRDGDDNVLFSDGNFEIGYEYFNQNYTLPQSGCYTFELFDTGEDGLHGSQYGGFDGSCYLRSLDDSGNVTAVLYANDGSYDFNAGSESALFEAGSPLKIDTRASVSMQIYPNPAAELLHLRWQDSNYEAKDIRIFDASGKILHRSTSTATEAEINCTHWNDGIYTVVIAQNGEIWSHRLMVIRD